jgi:hypothetical protein
MPSALAILSVKDAMAIRADDIAFCSFYQQILMFQYVRPSGVLQILRACVSVVKIHRGWMEMTTAANARLTFQLSK